MLSGAMNAALLVTGGDAPDFAVIRPRLGEFSFICAADSGLDTLHAWGLRADLVVGDFDSLKDASILGEYPEALRHPEDKDDTDTELALEELRSRGFKRIVMAGGGGGRIDHLFALRALFEREDGPDEWLTPAERIVRIREETAFPSSAGALVSVFPLAGGAQGMRSRGLRWPLEGLRWNAGQFGISNVAEGQEIAIDPGKNPLLVVLAHDRTR